MSTEFNAIEYSLQLQAVGVSRPEAEVHARAVFAALQDCRAGPPNFGVVDGKLDALLAVENREADVRSELSTLRAEMMLMREDLKFDRWTSYITFVIVLVLFFKLVVP
jgi:hypothetical protein